MRFSIIASLALASAVSADGDLGVPTTIGGVPTVVSVPSSLPTSVKTSLPTSVKTSLPTSVKTSLPTSVKTSLPTGVTTHLPTGTSLATTLTSKVPTSLPTTKLPTSVSTPKVSGLTSLPTTKLPTSVPTTLTVKPPTLSTSHAASSVSATASAAQSSLAAKVNNELLNAARVANNTRDVAAPLAAPNGNASQVVPATIGGFNQLLPILSTATNDLNAAIKAHNGQAAYATTPFDPASCLSAADVDKCMSSQLSTLNLQQRDTSIGGGAVRRQAPAIFVPEQSYTLSTSFGGYVIAQDSLMSELKSVRPHAGAYVAALKNAITVLEQTGDALALALEGSATQYASTIRSTSASADAAANAALVVYAS